MASPPIGDFRGGPYSSPHVGHKRRRIYGHFRVVQRVVKKAGIQKHITPHSLRHTFVTLALDSGVSVRDAANGMGYSDTRMVSYYDHGKDNLPRNATHFVAAYVEGS